MDEIQQTIERLAQLGYQGQWDTGGSWMIHVDGKPPADCPLCGGGLVESDALDSGDSFILEFVGCEADNIWWRVGEYGLT